MLETLGAFVRLRIDDVYAKTGPNECFAESLFFRR